jgi:signal transduction histidine kinase
MAQEQNIPPSVTIARINLGATYMAKRVFDSAALNLDDALRLACEQTNNRVIAIALHYKSLLAYQTGRFSAALPLAQEALNIATQLNAREEQEKNFKLLADIYAAEGRYREAFETECRYEALKDSLFNLDNTKVIANLQALYTTEKKDAEIQLLKRDVDIHALELRRQTTLRNSLVAGVFGLLVLAGVLANRYWLKQRSEKALQDKNLEILRQQKILEEQAAEIELVNTELHESNMNLLDANDELQKMYQEILRQQHILEEQAADIEENNTKLHESNIALQRLDLEKSELLGIVAHDLKNPLGSIIVNASTLHRYQETLTPAQIGSIAGRIVDVGSRMRDILEDLLNMNAIETGAMTVRSEAFDISELTQMVLENYRSAAEGKFLSLHFASDTPAMFAFADKGKTEEVLDNLISNAVKYSPQGKNVFVRVRCWSLVIGREERHWSFVIGQSRSHSSLVMNHLSDQNRSHPTDQFTNDQFANIQPTNDYR